MKDRHCTSILLRVYHAAVHEVLGLIACYVIGKTDALFPAPR
jgi:hypothetical protein